MSDDHATDESRDDHPDAGEAFETARTATRAEAAAALRGLADGVDAGTVALGEGEDGLTATVSDTVEFEVEYERADDEAELEVELVWTPDDEPAETVGSAGEVVDASESDGTDGSADERPAVETATVAAGADPAAEVPAAGSEDEPSDSEAEPAEGKAETATDAGDESPAGGADEPTEETDDPTGVVPSIEPETERPAAPVVAAAAPVVSQARFELFRDRAAEWRWRLVHRNGNVIASSGEGYTRKHNAEKGMRSVMTNAPGADVVGD